MEPSRRRDDSAAASLELGVRNLNVPDVAISDMMGRTVEPYEVAHFNGGAVFNDIPIASRDTADQVVFRDSNNYLNYYGDSARAPGIEVRP